MWATSTRNEPLHGAADLLLFCRREEYRQQQYRLGEAIASSLLPNLQLRLDDILPR
ncbi:MAG: hypothetical protein ACKO24_03175 [Leptolyngbyaceae cyanobacterium]